MSDWTWTTQPSARRIDLEYQGHKFWVELKEELNQGEETQLKVSGMRRWGQDETDKSVEVRVDWETIVFSKVMVWLADWSLTNAKNDKLPRTLDTLRALRPGVFKEIEKAVDVHAKEVGNREKKVLSEKTDDIDSPSKSSSSSSS